MSLQNSELSQTIETWRESLGRPTAEILTLLGLSTADAGRGYGATTDLELARARDVRPEVFYLQNGRVVLVYVSGEALRDIHPDDLAAAFPDTTRLRSRAGRRARHHVDSVAGIAWSADHSRVHLLELFEPCDIDAYTARWYSAPPTFIR